jgi:hypothetical protein
MPVKREMSRQRRYQLRKIAEGLCGYCGKRKLFNKSRCKKCEKQKYLQAQQRASKQRRRAQ